MARASVPLLLFFVYLQVLYRVDAKIADADAIKSCKDELNVDDATVERYDRLRAYDESNNGYNTFISCTWKKLELQDNDGKINFPNLIDYVTDFCQKLAGEVFTVVPDRAIVEGWLSGCRDLQGNNDGQNAAKVHFCLAKGIDQFRATHKKH